MPHVHKLSPAQVKALEDKGKSTRKLTEEEYDSALSDFATGDYGEISLQPKEKRLTISNRVKAAGQRRGLTITFIPTRGDAMRFKVGAGDGRVKPKKVRRERDWQDQPTPVVPALNAPSTTKRKGGRPRKQPV